jgi:hypothetical protein
MAADQGDAEAQLALGGMYAAGLGVPEDYVSAHMWFNLAAARGNEDAAKMRERVAKLMNQAQIAEAQRLAREWAPQETRWIRPFPPSGSEWVFRIGRSRDIRFCCGLGLIARVSFEHWRLSMSVMRSRTDSQRMHRHFRV